MTDSTSTHSPASPNRRSDGAPRRSILVGAAWTVPVLASAVAVPLASASGPLPPGVTIVPGNGPWTDRGTYDGWVAEGVSISVADAEGRPLASQSVTLYLTQDLGDLGDWKRNNLWFVDDPALSASDARRSANQRGSITLFTDENGVLNLDTPGGGHLRKGSNGESEGQYLVVLVDGVLQGHVNLVVSSAAGGTNPGVQPAAG